MVEKKKAAISKQKAKKDNLQVKVEELTEDLKRIQADFINFKRRSEEEMSGRGQLVKAHVLATLLPTLDNLDRAMSNTPKDLANNEWVTGVVKAAEQMRKDLTDLGLERMETKGQTFDPEFMDAVAVEGEGDNEIVAEELQSGYLIDGEVIRHATVKVERK